MGWLKGLCWWVACSCAVLGGSEEATWRRCPGTNSNIFTLEVHRGDSRPLILPLDPKKQKIVTKYDPETKQGKDQILAGPGTSHPLKDKTASISLVGQNFTVWNASGTEEGLFRITQHLDGTCLAVVSVTVVDLPLPATVTPSFTISSNIPKTVMASINDLPLPATATSPFSLSSNITETVETSSPGINYTTIYVAVPIVCVFLIILIAGWFFIVPELIKRWPQDRANESTSAGDPEQCMNGLLPHLPHDSTTTF